MKDMGTTQLAADFVEHDLWTDERWYPVRPADGKYRSRAQHIKLDPSSLNTPLWWHRPRRILVCPSTDLFHPQVPDAYLDQVFGMMLIVQEAGHVFQVPTIHLERARDYLQPRHRQVAVRSAGIHMLAWPGRQGGKPPLWGWPLANVYLGAIVETQQDADTRLALLRDTSAALRLLFIDPLVSAIDLRSHLVTLPPNAAAPPDAIHWVYLQGESRGPAHRRLVHPYCLCTHRKIDHRWAKYTCEPCANTRADTVRCRAFRFHDVHISPEALAAVRTIRDQCLAAGVPFYFGDWGRKTPTTPIWELDGKTWHQLPDDGRHWPQRGTFGGYP